ncbi:BTB/POZ domain-containing protein 16 isoform X2 [Hoplias malabaricus]|uniref:BTB/POZ domain-containing protein 16 isoform X2 n=1 Tax=Hoplias malabaricus TaxID=27720 RepID=UPI00346265A9
MSRDPRSDGQSHRWQAGHTNRWRQTLPPAGNLLGQAQAQRAVSLAHRTCTSGDTLRWCNITSRQDTPLLLTTPAPPTGLSPAGVLFSPEHSFYLLSQEVTQSTKPDAVLECLGSLWELHCPFLSRSKTLSELYMSSKKQRHTLLRSRAGSSQTETSSRWLSSTGRWGEMLKEDGGMGTSRGYLKRPILLRLPIKDPSITKEGKAVFTPNFALSFALGTLYCPMDCPKQWSRSVLSSADLLGLPQLYQRCLKEMMAKVTSLTVCEFHRVSCKHKQADLQSVCERWLELFLVTDLSCQINLRDLPFDLLLKTLRCPRVFAVSEYDLLRTVLYWIYLQFNTTGRTLPSHSVVLNFFCSLRSTRVFLEQPQGLAYLPLFQALHLHGITERHHLKEMQRINVFPHSWLLLTFSNHYYTIHSGGDMHVVDFTKHSVRFGMIIDGELQLYTRAVGLYGFYFLLKASRVGDTDTFAFSMERLRHWEPVLGESCRTLQVFSVRSDRRVLYQISVQSCASGEWKENSSGVISQVFGLSKRCAKSRVFTVDRLSSPLLVTFALAFPSQ